jgi:16S rRNA (guanine(527)-N(7))-methyltransferase RsmG
MTPFLELLLHHLGGLYPINDWQLKHLNAHFDLLRKWNQKINLTSLESMEDIVVRHYCEAIALAYAIPLTKCSVVDVGSGAGFPGIPFAIMRGNCFVHLVESDTRKSVFLREGTLFLQNCLVHKIRFEQFRMAAEWLIGRAVHWRDLREAAENTVDHVALLVGEETVAEVTKEWASAQWREPVKLPWGRKRFILIGDFGPQATEPKG